MRPVHRIAPPAWMQASSARLVFAALDASGQGMVGGRFVGGCVRDALLGHASQDIDIATPWPPDRVMERLAAAGLRALPTGIDHGTVTALVDGWRFEITTLRHDVETDGRHALVAFTDDWTADAARRDFTVNALYADADGTIYDPVGGLLDLEEGRVRFVGIAGQRIQEDALRMLRFFRFHARYGRGQPDAEALAACRSEAQMIDRLSGERIAQEFRRLLMGPKVAETVAQMAAVGLLVAIHPALGAPSRLGRIIAIEDHLGADDWLRRFAMMVDGTEAHIALAGRLRLSNHERKRLIAFAKGAKTQDFTNAQAWRVALYRQGVENAVDHLLAAWANDSLSNDAGAELYAAAQAWRRPTLPIQGADLAHLGLEPGPEMGAMLRAIEDWWIEADFAPDRAACLGELARRLGVQPA